MPSKEILEAFNLVAKREEIREGISAKQNRLYRGICTILNETENMIPAGRSERILKFLHSEGCVLKVERALPTLVMHELEESNQLAKDEVYGLCTVDMLRAGYVAVEPLIEE